MKEATDGNAVVLTAAIPERNKPEGGKNGPW